MSLSHDLSAGRTAPRSRWGLRALAFSGLAAMAATGFSAEVAAAPSLADSIAQLTKLENVTAFAVDNFFVFICAVLVLFMQAGFAILETGLNESKNAVNILSKNIVDMTVGAILFYIVGYGLMYPGAAYAGQFFGFGGMGITSTLPEAAGGALTPQVNFLFQVAFAATAATIVSGSVAGRLKFNAYLIYTIVISALIYPISGMWTWGGGWLAAMGFRDFAGSIVVHAVGGWAGLAGAIVLGPRLGRFVGGKAQTIPGHNLTFAALGAFILVIGWFGFNPGSQLAILGEKNTNAVAMVATNTLLAGCMGTNIALLLSWFITGAPKLSMAINGMLAGLVGITANCDAVTNVESLIIGAIAGVLVVGACYLLEMLKIDDPVGAWPVHGVCGMWGGIATGIFGDYNLGTQIIGTLTVSAFSFVCMLALFFFLKSINCLRVSDEHETKGLDHHEHGEGAYG